MGTDSASRPMVAGRTNAVSGREWLAMRRRCLGGRTLAIASSMLILIVGLAGCGQATPGPAVSGVSAPGVERTGSSVEPSSWQAEWDRVLAAAKQEGRVAVLGPPGEAYRQVWDAFQKKYGIAVDLVAGRPADLAARVDLERQAGQFLWDVAAFAPGTMFTAFKPKGWLDPLRPALILPEVLDDSKWLGGFAAGFMDTEKTHVYAFLGRADWNVLVNRNLVPESELSRVDQLWDPKWAEKIAINDPLAPGAGQQIMSVWLVLKGEDKLRSFMRDQRPVATRDDRQLGEWVLRGRYPIGIGFVPSVLEIFEQQGLSTEHVKPLRDDDPANFRLSYGQGAVGIFNRTPHPNAAKVFINWLLSQEGQTVFAERTGNNVRRTDAPIVDPEQAIDPAKQYVSLTSEEEYPMREKAVEIMKQVVR
jgi:iron(III) transport system substrate-binding protein